MTFVVPFDNVQEYAALYDYKINNEDDLFVRVRYEKNHKGFLTKETFMDLGRWKSSRLISKAMLNLEEEIVELTGMSFHAKTERGRIMPLIGLSGVGWPMASVILHAAFEESYPIIDVRALGTLGLTKKPVYDLGFWNKYAEFCREQIKRFEVSMRNFDRALWAYSKTHDIIAQ